jgi:glycosidase
VSSRPSTPSAALWLCGAVLVAGPPLAAAGCGNDKTTAVDYGQPPDASTFDPGQGGPSPSGSGSAGSPTNVPDAGPVMCPDSLKLCAETFTYPYNGEMSVELRGSYRQGAWTMGDAMMHVGNQWTVSVNVPWNQPVEYKFFVNGMTWATNPMQPTTMDDAGDVNNLAQPITCPGDFTCSMPPVPPAGVFDWRDAVIYFTFIDRFNIGQTTAPACNVSGAETTATSSTNYLGGNWAGVTEKIKSNYFTNLGVTVLWITVPVKNADNVVGAGVECDGSGNCSNTSHEYSAYHGYWPADPTTFEPCFGTQQDLTDLVQAAHAAKIKVLFDYAMVHVHTSSSVYTQNVNNGWFTPFCQCGGSCAQEQYNTTCWFAPYLAHYDYTNPAASAFTINAALSLIKTYGNDAFRLDAIKQVDTSWLTSLRSSITSQILPSEMPQQRFYMVGETYDFQNRGLIASLVNPTTMLDGQYDFPLRIRLVEGILMRSTQNMLTPDDLNWGRTAPPGMQGIEQFMDGTGGHPANDGYYGPTAVMSTFIGNADLPRSIHFAEDTLPSWLSSSADNGQTNGWESAEPALETEQAVYDRLANVFGLLMTNPGAPLIYYGDEIGMPGAGDPDNRRMMQWSGYIAPQQTLLARVQALGQLRAAHPAMRRGVRTTLDVSADLWVYEMATASGDPMPDTVYVAINRSDNDLTTSKLPSGLTELLTNTPEGASPVTIPARQTRIYK